MDYLYRASGAPMWIKCPAWRRMHTGQPDIGDTTIREEGTAFHWGALMTWLGHSVPPSTIAPNKVSITEEMSDCFDEYIDRIKTWPGATRLEYELHAAYIHSSCGGTTDVLNWDEATRTLRIADAKYGYRPVDPFEFWQGIVYACGALDAIGINATNDHLVSVEFYIYQPRVYARSAWSKPWRVKASDLRAYFNQLRMAAEAGDRDNPKALAGPHCHTCNGRWQCATFQESAGLVLDIANEAMHLDMTVEQTDAELLKLDAAYQIIEARREALRARAEMFITSGQQMPSWEMGRTGGRLRWVDEASANAAIELGKALGKPIHKVIPITPTQAGKIIDPDMLTAFAQRTAGSLKLTRVDPNKARKIFS